MAHAPAAPLPFRRGSAAFLMLLGAGCKHDAVEIPDILDPVGADASGVWIGEGLGASPLTVPVFATNSLGAPVPGSGLSVTGGDATATTLAADDGGWAETTVTAAGVGRYPLTASAGGATAAGAATIVRGTPGTLDGAAFPLGEAPSAVAHAAGGVAAAIGGEVWWTSVAGAPPVRVLALPEPVTALVPVNAGGDSVGDLLVVSDAHVVLLAGRAAGGLTWSAGWAAKEGNAIAAATVADADGDDTPDLTVIQSDGGSGVWVLQLHGDGSGGFAAFDALPLAYEVYSVSVEDLDADGVGEVTVLGEEGLLRRYTHVDGAWEPVSWQYELGLSAGGRLWPSTDLTGDGHAEIIAAGPSLEGGSWLAWVITAGAAAPEQYAIVSASAGAASLGLAVGDVSGDGLPDLVVAAPDTLDWAVWDGTTFQIGEDDLPGETAMDLADVDGDAVLDLVLGGASLRVLPGERVADGAEPALTWDVRGAATELYGLDLLLEPQVHDLDADGIVDVLAVADSGAGPTLTALHGVAADEALVAGRSVALGGTPLAAVACGSRAFALYDDGGTWLVEADLDADLDATPSAEPLAVDGTLLACGSFTAGVVAVVATDGAVTYVDADGVVTAGDPIGDVSAVTTTDADGDGLDTLVGCAEPGCYVSGADVDGDGLGDVTVQDSSGVSVTTASGTWTANLPGVLRVSDADGDGVADLVSGADGVARVVRVVPGGLSPAVASWTWQPVQDAVQLGDLDGDGIPDAFFLGDADGSLWAGSLVYAHAE